MRLPLHPIPPHVDEVLTRRRAAQRNLYGVLSNSPEAVESWLDFLWSLRDNFLTPRDLRELLILRVAVREQSAYEWHHHERMALSSGLAPKKIAAIRSARTANPAQKACSAVFDATELLAIEFADAVVSGKVDDELAGRVVSHVGRRSYVELAVTASAYVMVARVLEALAVPLEAAPADGR